MIHSIQTAPEETVLLSGGLTPAGQVWEQDDDALPQQVHVSRLPDASITLNPGQVALIPLTFLPRYPKVEEDVAIDEFATQSDDWSPPRLSSSSASIGKISRTARVDLEDMIGVESLISESPTTWRGMASSRRPHMAPTSSTSPEAYEVRTTIIVETSRGVVKLPITASSIRHNLFGIPDVIYFEKSSSKQEETSIPKPTTSSMPRTAVDVMLLDTDIFDSVPIIQSEGILTERRAVNNTLDPDDNRECYDIYVTNPSSEREMEVSEIFVSRPELVTVEIKADEDNPYQNFRGHFPTGPSHVVRDWNQNGGPFVLEPGAKDEYIATLCTTSTQVQHDEAADLFLEDMARWFEDKTREQSLGYAQIRTQTESKPDTLVIHLESWSPPKITIQPNSEHQSSNRSDDLRSSSQEESVDRFAAFDRSVFSSSPSIFISGDGDILDLDEVILSEESTPATEEPEAGLLLQAMPSRADLRLVRTAGSNNSEAVARASFGVRNRAPLPLRIMRATVGMNAVDSDKLSGALQQLGMQLKIRIGGSGAYEKLLTPLATWQGPTSAHPDPFILPSESVVDDALILSCSIQSNTSLVWEDSLGFSGLVIVRATPDTHLSYESWREEMTKNPNRDSQFVMEIPYSIRVVQGRIDFVMEGSTHPTPYLFHGKPYIGPGRSLTALFFPLSRYNLEPANLLDEETPYEGTHLMHIIRVISNMPASLEVGTVAVRDSNSSESKSVCEQFEVTHENKLAGQVREAWGLVDFGLITLRYFPAFNEVSQLPLHRCFLEVTTSPENTGAHRVELVLYSGRIDVESTADNPAQTLAPDGSRHTLGWPSSAMAGLDPFLKWFKSTRTGASLRTLLSSRRKSHNSTDEALLRKYLASIVDTPVRPDASLKPILLQAGAIESGEVKTTFLFLTNKNPVPVVISIEVGEVEGLRIYTGRDKSRSEGDGNSVLDYLPKAGRLGSLPQSYVEDKIVPSGDWKGHPLKGLKHFLSSELSTGSLQSHVPYRSAISLSDAALLKQPMLRSLYADKGFVEFHSKSVPIYINNNASSPCHIMMNETAASKQHRGRKGLTPNGPLFMSDDGSFYSPRARCWVRKNEANHVALEEADIVIPSGAVARFEIVIRAPPKSELTEDITQFFASGLVLSNDHGEVLPIFVAFEALQGQLHASHVLTTRNGNDSNKVSEKDEIYDSKVVDVEAQLFRRPTFSQGWQNVSSSLTIYPESSGLKKVNGMRSKSETNSDENSDAHERREANSVWLFLKSTFSRNVRLRVVQSCNPWFEVLLQDAGRLDYLPGFGTRVGEIRSSIDCDISASNDESSKTYASFYQCAWKWLTKRSDLQPRGCGLAQSKIKSLERENDSAAPNYEANRAIRSLENAMRVLKRESMEDDGPVDFIRGSEVASWGRVTGKRSDGYIAPFVVDVFAEAWYAWRKIASLGLNSLTSGLTALIDCTDHNSDPPNSPAAMPSSESPLPVGNLNLTVSMQDISLRTSLEMPVLFDSSRIESDVSYGKSLKLDELLSHLDFPPTLVGIVSSLSIPLRNPTSVPVRVRLAAASLVDSTSDTVGSRTSDGRASERFLLELGMVYVQRGTHPSEVVPQPWWDGGRAFYQANDDGDLIQSLHNATIRGGTNAYVTVLHPSLHATSAFLVGCGPRCGVRDDLAAGMSGNEPRLSSVSPIGASSAVGISLVGRQRSHLTLSESLNIEEPNVPASGTLVPQKAASAFAIPYAALDEIVLPPFGEATIGPIYFRPPGRYNVLGCNPAHDNNVAHWGTKSATACASGLFESMLFLENSLTGLERIILRGSGLWSKATFVDPEPTFGADSFGNIEYRNGRPALMFSGTAEMRSPKMFPYKQRKSTDSKPLPLVKEVMILNGTSASFGTPVAQNPIKEVLLANDGDVPLFIRKVFFSDSRVASGKKASCVFGNFRLLNCREEQGEQPHAQSSKYSTRGFELSPGENHSFYIEHRPDCSKRREFVTLKVEHTTSRQIRNMPVGRTPLTTHTTLKETKTFHRGKTELMVGYEMSDEEFRRCKSSRNVAFQDVVRLRQRFRAVDGNNQGQPATAMLSEQDEPCEQTYELQLTTIRLLSMIIAGLMITVLSRSNIERLKSNKEFKSKLKGQQLKPNADEQFPATQSNWLAAFRCLARLDPTSIELQSLGKEQVRQVVIGQYRALGAIPPQCLSAAGSFHRDRSGSGNVTGRVKDGTNERAFTISDAIFCSYQDDFDSANRGVLPANLGWRTAFARGVISNASFLSGSTETRTKELLRSRRKTSSLLEANERRSDGNVLVVEQTESVTDGRSSNLKSVGEHDRVDNTEDVVSTSDSESTQPAKENGKFIGLNTVHQDTCVSRKQEIVKDDANASTPVRKYRDMKSSERLARTDPTTKNTIGQSTTDVILEASGTVVARNENLTLRDTKRGADQIRSEGQSTPSKTPHAPISELLRNLNGRESLKEGPKTIKLGNSASRSTTTANPKEPTTYKKKELAKPSSLNGGVEDPESAHSPSSMKSLSSRSSNQTTTDDSPETTRLLVSPMRPPPGIGPPPGFLEPLVPDPLSPMLTPATSSVLPFLSPESKELGLQNVEDPLAFLPSSQSPFSPIAFGDTDLLPPAMLSDDVRESLLRDTELHPLSPVIGSSRAEQEKNLQEDLLSKGGATGVDVDSELLFTRGSAPSFNVMDFLDNILNEGNTSETEESGVILPENSILPVSSNPWALGRQSRAAAYGINFEDGHQSEEESSAHNNHSVNADQPIPLLTPAAILSASRTEGDDAYDGSFYSSLLGE